MLIQLLQEVIIRAGQLRVRFLCLFGFFRIHRNLGGRLGFIYKRAVIRPRVSSE